VAKSLKGAGSAGGARAGRKGQAAGIKRSRNRWGAAAFRFNADEGRRAPKEPWAEAGSGEGGKRREWVRREREAEENERVCERITTDVKSVTYPSNPNPRCHIPGLDS
jgi:hypothetical protein